MSRIFNCPDCGLPLEQVRYPPGSMFNREQWESMRAGDWFCANCKSDKAKSGFKYFWERDLRSNDKYLIDETPSLSESELEKLRAENEALKTRLQMLLEYTNWITMPCAVERLPKVGDELFMKYRRFGETCCIGGLVTFISEKSLELRFCEDESIFAQHKDIICFKIIERAAQ